MLKIVDTIGYYGPVILFSITFFCLLTRSPYLLIFTIGSILNSISNKIIKNIFREPRQDNQLPFLGEGKFEGIERYGFPSGHAQSCFFSLGFLFFINGPQAILYSMTFICAMTLYQRYKYRRHTIKQLVFGSIIGILFAYIMVYTTQYYLYGNKNNIYNI
jgi:membrane-associated phospholipid phosphatase